jgi:hypothetical protein
MSLSKRLISQERIFDGDLSNASDYASKTLTVGSQGDPRGGCISADGTRLITTHLSGTQHWFNQYNFSTAFDVTSIGTVQKTYQTTATIENYMTGCLINKDLDWISYDPYYTNNYYSQPLSTAGDISTAGTIYTDTCVRTGGERTSSSQFLSRNEDTLYLQYDAIKAISLSTAGDLSSGSGCGTTTSIAFVDSDLSSNTRSCQFNNDGTKFYGGGDQNGKIVQYDLSTAYDISSKGTGTVFDFSSILGSASIRYMQFNDEQSHIYLLLRVGTSSPYTHKVWDLKL